jgi:hypothetical protein
MIKFKQGWIASKEGNMKDIVVKAAAPNKFKDILIGGLLLTAGVAYLTTTAFKYGSKKFEEAETETLVALNLLED